ncbi:MAG: AsmA family protein [Alistipes sp.]|nr:AsmA family protein [Alistipes sp.]
MRNFLKAIAALVVLVVAVALVAPLAFRGKIEQIIKQEANKVLLARLDFDKLNISLLRHFPNASLDLKGLTLVGVDRFEGDTIVAADRISVVVNPLSILGESGFEVKKVLFAAPQLHAHKLADGAVNWDVMRPTETPETVETPETPETVETVETPSSFRLAVRDFRISNAVIRYEDDSTHLAFSTRPLDLRLRGDLSAAESQLDLRLGMERTNLRSGVVQLLSDAELELKAKIAADLEHMSFRFSENTLRLNAITLSLDGWAELLDNGGVAMDILAGTERVAFKELLSLVPAFYTREFRNLTAGGELSLSLWARGELSGSQLPAFELKAGVKEGRFQYAALPKAVTDINLAARIANPGGVMDRTEVELSHFGLKMAGNAIKASFYGTNLMSDPQLKGALRGEIDLGAIKDVYPLEGIDLKGRITADLQGAGRLSDVEKQRYNKLSASGTFVVEGMRLTMAALPPIQLQRAAATINPSEMTLGELSLTVGQSDMKAHGQLTNYLGYLLQGSTLEGRLYVNSELLELNELMTALASSQEEAEAPAAAETPAESPAAEGAAMAVAVPENLSLSLATNLKQIRFQQLDIRNLTGEVRVADEAVALNKLSMQLFGGRASASGSYSTKQQGDPALKMNLALERASFKQSFEQLELVRQLVPLFAKTGGDYSLSLDLSTRLTEQMTPVMQSINATGQLRSENINLQQIELFGQLADLTKQEQLRKIEAKDLKVEFAVKDGRLTTRPFTLKMGSMGLTLSGSTGLDQTIDYEASLSLPEGSAGGILSRVGVDIGGTFTKPTFQLGVKKAAEEAVKNALDQQVRQLTGSENLSAEIDKRAEQLRQEAVAAGEELVKVAEEQREKLVEAAAKKGALAKIAAEKAGDKLVSEAKKQAEKLVAKAEEQIAKL